jgi:hypothetical protein
MPQAPGWVPPLRGKDRPLPPLQVLWLPTSDGPVPYVPRVAEQVCPPDVWIQGGLTLLARI